MSTNGTFQQSFTGQLLQSPPYQYNQQYLGPLPPGTPMMNQGTNQTPPWAIAMMETMNSRLDKIDSRLDKIDNIEKVVNSMCLKLNDLDIKVKSIESRVCDVENNSTFISEKYDKQTTELASTKDSVKTMQNHVTR